jgi:hypothetical protein
MTFHLSDSSYFTHQFLDGPYARVPKELGCAFAASFVVSPIVSIIDKAIVQEITGAAHLLKTMGHATKELVFAPRAFFSGLGFRLTFLVYFGTYAAANCSEAALDFYKIREEKVRKTWKVSMAASANIGLLAWRDAVFARAFSGGRSAPAARTPMRTIALFGVRDTATMFATFYAAPKAAEILCTEHDVNKDVAEIGTSLTIPVVSQFLTAPIHIHAIDFFARPDSTGAERVAQIRKEMSKVCFFRGVRILPAFGIGSYSNNKFRELTIRQPNEELLLTRRITRRITQLNESIQARRNTRRAPPAVHATEQVSGVGGGGAAAAVMTATSPSSSK